MQCVCVCVCVCADLELGSGFLQFVDLSDEFFLPELHVIFAFS